MTRSMDQQAHFTEIRQVIIHELFRARNNIKVAVCWITNYELLDTLIHKAIEGVNIQLIIVNDAVNYISDQKFQRLVNKGGQLYFASLQRLMHNKYCVIDDGVLVNGSYNWTDSAESNEENIMIFRNNHFLIEAFLANFERIKSTATQYSLGSIYRHRGDSTHDYVVLGSTSATKHLQVHLPFGRAQARVATISNSPSPALGMYRTLLSLPTDIDTDLGKSTIFDEYFGVAFTRAIPDLTRWDPVDIEILSYQIGVIPEKPEKGETLVAKCRMLKHKWYP